MLTAMRPRSTRLTRPWCLPETEALQRRASGQAGRPSRPMVGAGPGDPQGARQGRGPVSAGAQARARALGSSMRVCAAHAWSRKRGSRAASICTSMAADGHSAKPICMIPCSPALAEATGLAGVSVEYRLAPEHPFQRPERLPDCGQLGLCPGRTGVHGRRVGRRASIAADGALPARCRASRRRPGAGGWRAST
jgi:hypothetical protein